MKLYSQKCSKSVHPLKGGGGGGRKKVYPVFRGGGGGSFRSAIFPFCSPPLPVINDQSLSGIQLKLTGVYPIGLLVRMHKHIQKK